MATTTWGAGAYPLMADQLRPAARAAVDRAAVRPGDRVVDIATGTGNAALLAAARGAEVIGVDFEPSLLAVAAQRAADLGLLLRWDVADVTALTAPDHWADVVLSVFGVMYAADHEAAARELARCAAPRARIVLASWIPGSFLPAMGQALSPWLPPPPPSSGPPSRWGDADALESLLASAGLRTTANTTERLAMTFSDAGAAADFFVGTAGHVVAERERLMNAGQWPVLLAALQELIEARGEQVAGRLRIGLDYLLTTAMPA